MRGESKGESSRGENSRGEVGRQAFELPTVSNRSTLNYEMEAGTLFTMGNVYGFAAGCVCGVIANRTASEEVMHEVKRQAEDNAIRVALKAAQDMDPEYFQPRYWK